MAEDTDSASKTEEPSARRLEQARERGDIVKTQDLPQVFSFAATASVLVILGGWLSNGLVAALTPFLQHPDSMPLQGGGGVVVARYAVMAGAPFILAVFGAAMICGAAGHLVQSGLLWTPDRLMPKLERLSPIAGFKRLFGVDALANFVKSLAKVVVSSLIAWSVMAPHARELQGLAGADAMAMLPFALNILKNLIFAVGGFMLAVAGFDWFWQRQRFLARHRMSREELKEDVKQSDGDPHIKARQRQLRMQRARRRMMTNVPKATLVVMNPTHFAVALRYDAEEGGAPQCVAKGVDSLALKIREVAEAAGVPVIEDPPLARALYAAVDIEDFIPVTHYEAVAKLIGFIMSKRPKVGAG